MADPDPRLREPRRSADPIAAGAPLALCTVGGTIIGSIAGQPSIGVVAGVALGAAIAIAMWLVDRRRVGR